MLMKIREKLFFGFSLYVLVAVAAALFAYFELRTISTRLKLVELADDTNNALLEVRRYEKNFLLFKDSSSFDELKKYLGILKKDTDNIKEEMIEELGPGNYGVIKRSLADYEKSADALAENMKSQEGLIKLITAAGREAEATLSGRELQIFLVLRRYEKNLMIEKDRKVYETFVKTAALLKEQRLTERYRLLVEKLNSLYTHEKEAVESMRLNARTIQSFIEEVSKRERQEIGSILSRAMSLIVYSFIAILVLGILVNVKLAMSISNPIRRLERVTKKVASGDFSEVIEVHGEDEIASLEQSFNQMEDRLETALDYLKATVKKLTEKQAQLVEAEKLASVGRLAAGIAHEINNPLTSLLTFSNLMLEQTPEGDPRRERLRLMAREAARARTIVRQLLSFAKEPELKLERINVNQPVMEIIESLKAQEAFEGIDLKANLSDSLPAINADPAKLGQVALNILLNSIAAITPPGSIEVSTNLSDGYIEIAFKDSGCGIPPENIDKIFDPFFTTKDSVKGTGLGLAVSYGIIKKHGGTIEVDSTVGKGSTFTVRLPVNG